MYRDCEQTYFDFLNSPSGLKYFQNVTQEEFQFLWYIYNRGGFLNNRTVALYYGSGLRVGRRRIARLVNRECLTLFLKKPIYKKIHCRGTSSYLYRVSNKFLAAVDNRNSTIRKTKDIKKAIVPLAQCNFFLEEPSREYVLVNRRERSKFLMDRLGLKESDLPKYFLGSRDKFVISPNQEIAVLDQNVFVIWYPESLMGTEFTRFAKRWSRVFTKSESRIKCLAITHNDTTKAFFKHIKTEPNAREEQQGILDKVMEIMEDKQTQQTKNHYIHLKSKRPITQMYGPNMYKITRKTRSHSHGYRPDPVKAPSTDPSIRKKSGISNNKSRP